MRSKTTRLLTTRLLAAAAAATLAALAMGPATAAHTAAQASAAKSDRAAATANSSSVKDKAGDVEKGEGADWFAPSIDIRKVTVTGQPAQKKVVVRMKVENLKELERGSEMYKQEFYVSNRSSDYEHAVRLTLSPWGEGTTAWVVLGDNIVPCKGAEWKVDPKADQVTLRVPVSCIDADARKSVKVGVSSTAYRTYQDGDQWIASDNAKVNAAVRVR